jgi:hypothetical protein
MGGESVFRGRAMDFVTAMLSEWSQLAVGLAVLLIALCVALLVVIPIVRRRKP